jgi:hypothetical protein
MGQHEAARMLGEMPRRPYQLTGENDRQLKSPVFQVEVEFFGVLGFDAFLGPAPDLRGQQLDQVFGQSQRYAREGADGQVVVCPLLRGSSPTRGVAPKQHRGGSRVNSGST